MDGRDDLGICEYVSDPFDIPCVNVATRFYVDMGSKLHVRCDTHYPTVFKLNMSTPSISFSSRDEAIIWEVMTA